MKKSKILAVGLLTCCLASCDFINKIFGQKEEEVKKGAYDINPVITGGTDAEQKAILETVNNMPICLKSGLTDIYPDVQPTLSEDNGDNIVITKTQKVPVSGTIYTVNLTWKVDETSPYFSKVATSDAAHDIIEIKYQGYGQPAGTFSWGISDIVCGSAASSNPNITYTAKIVGEEYKHDDVKISAINSVTDHDPAKEVVAGTKTYTYPSTFDIVDYEYHDGVKYSPYFKTNNEGTEKAYLYYNVYGKVIYNSPDGNWALIADGDQVLELYQGAGTALLPKNYPNLSNGYVKVAGNMGQYNGNIQLGFITQVKEAKSTDVTEPVMTFPALTENDIADLELGEGYTCQKQAINGFSGSLHSITGTIVADSLKNRSGNAVTPSALANDRFTFEVQVGAKKMTVAYDYHTDKDASHGIFNGLKDKLAAGGEITIKGTMRYNGNDTNPFVLQGNSGVWNIIPFDSTHIA